MKAFILAAGFGKRMGELTANRPKPLLPLSGQPLIVYTLFQLHRWGVTEAMINLHYLGEQIEAALRNFPHFPLRYSHESRLLGTAGGLRQGIDLGFFKSGDWCLVANPDVFLRPEAEDAPPRPAALDDDLDAVLYLKPLDPRIQATGFSFIEAAKDLIQISESGQYYYIGYGMVRAGSIERLERGETVELRPVWRTSGERGRLKGLRFRGDVWDLGTRDAYEAVQKQHPNPIPSELEEQWRAFLAGWADSRES